MGNKANTGPKPIFDKAMVKIKVTVREEDRALVRQIGGGNMSRGVRKAINFYRDEREKQNM